MKTLPILLLGVALFACHQTKLDTMNAEKTKAELKRAGRTAKADLKKAAAATGSALEKAGKKLEEKAKH